MAGQGCNTQCVRFRKQAAFEKRFHLQRRFDESLITSLTCILCVTKLLEKDQRNMIVNETRSEFDQATSQVGAYIPEQLGCHSIFYGIKIAGLTQVGGGRSSQFKQSLSLRNGICAKLFEAKHIGAIFRLLNLLGLLELCRQFIEAKYFSACGNGIAFIHKQKGEEPCQVMRDITGLSLLHGNG